MMTAPSTAFLSELFDLPFVGLVAIPDEDLRGIVNVTGREELFVDNVYHILHLMKKWAGHEGYIIATEMNCRGIWHVTVTKCFDESCDTFHFSTITEFEAVNEACEAIFKGLLR